MVKEIFLAILLSILSMTNLHTGEVFTPEVRENPAAVFSQGLTERDIAVTYPYTYEDMMLDITYLEMKYPDIIEVDTIGTSEWGYPIWSIVLGKGEKKVMINAAHHAREYPTTSLVMKMINYYAQLYEKDEAVEPYGNVRELLDKVSIHFVPCVNPDGVKIAQGQLQGLSKEKLAELKSLLRPGETFENWKANGQGVDLNANYPAKWKRNRKPYSSQNSGGIKPGEAKEVQAMMEYTKKHDFLSTVSYHHAGGILFWYFGQTGTNRTRDYRLTQELGNLTGYTPLTIEAQIGSTGGYKDWYVQEFKRPAWTIEIGKTVNERPIPEEEMLEAWKRNKHVGLWLADMVLKENIQ